jgi:transposase
MVTASDRSVVVFSLSAGNVHDAKAGYSLLEKFQRCEQQKYLIMDKAYESDAFRGVVIEKGFIPVVPPKSNRKQAWDYDEELYKKRNEIERYFLRLKRFRRIFTRYDKLDVMFIGFICFAMVMDAILV